MNNQSTDAKYFEEYEDLSVHELMLKDKPRIDAYRKAILNNKDLFKDKIVMDIGAGTGILSILCAQAGAAKVFAIEPTNLSNLIQEIAQENNYENIVDVYNCKVEEFELPCYIDKVDVIVSEWMGFYLLHEGMLDSVIYGRDKFLKDNGVMIPETATIYMSPCSIPNRFTEWDDIFGVKMKTFANALRHQKSHKPEIMIVNKEQLRHEGVVIAWLDLREITLADLSEFIFKDIIVIKNAGRYDGVCLWFDCNMTTSTSEEIILSTSPFSSNTHWKHTVIVFPENACTDVEENEPVGIDLRIKRNINNPRWYDISLDMIDQSELEHVMPCDCYMTKCILSKTYMKSTEQ